MPIFDTPINSIKLLTEGLLNYADTFSFVVREEIETSENIVSIISDLAIYQVEKKSTTEWPGTKLLLDSAIFYRFILNYESAFILYNYEDNLFEWLSPKLPEDLVFYLQENPIFISITHEKDAYFEADSSNLEVLKTKNLL